MLHHYSYKKFKKDNFLVDFLPFLSDILFSDCKWTPFWRLSLRGQPLFLLFYIVVFDPFEDIYNI